MSARFSTPDLMPTLSAGHHRTPKRGACFMEFASYLAGERWSDHPRCTDPTLSALARAVNDLMRDSRRSELAVDVPRVIGLRGDDRRIGLLVALRAASSALPVASMDRQRALAVAVLALVDALDTVGVHEVRSRRAAEDALAQNPDAAAWAAGHLAVWGVNASELVRRGCDAIIRASVLGVAQACVPDADDRLAAMLRAAIEDVEAYLGAGSTVAVGMPEPVAV
ncbi:MAG: hypothetical protein HY996_08340 [Micrococcales bacterium]|nr:hypothetical protein [Micrococcales bacterium]